MRALFLGSAAAAALALTAAPAAAQPQTSSATLAVTGRESPTAGVANTPSFTSVAVTVPGTSVTLPAAAVAGSTPSPFAATLSGSSLPGANGAVTVFCADLLNEVSFSPNGFAVNVTRLGANAAPTATRFTDANALTRYRKASVLASRWGTLPADQVEDLQMAIWSVMYDFSATTFGTTNLIPAARRTGATGTNGGNVASLLGWVNGIAATDFAGWSFSRAYVLTDAAVSGVATTNLLRYDGTGRQEFVTAASVVPEPSTYAMMGLGLAGLVGVVRRQRQGAVAR